MTICKAKPFDEPGVTCAALCRRWVVACVVVLSWCTVPTMGQLMEQSFDLQIGWNSVFLEINAVPERADDVFDGLPIASVWMRAAEPLPAPGSICDGPDDLNCVVVDDTEWRAWFPPSPAADAVTSLRVIRGGNVYLINATAPTTLTVTGIPSGFSPRYRPGYNLRGFYTVSNAGSTPTVGSYLQPAEALGIDTASVQQVGSSGSLSAVPESTQIAPGRGYWVRSAVEVDYDGPLDIDTATVRGVDFGTSQLTHLMSLRNLASVSREVTVSYLPSLPTVPAGLPSYAGDVPAHWLDFGSGGQVEDILQWTALTSHTFGVPAAGMDVPDSSLEIGVRRAGLAPAEVNANNEGSLYQGLLEIADGAGSRRLVALTTEVLGTTTTTAGASTDRPGLYLGVVSVDHVTWVTAGARVWTNDDAAAPQFDGLMKCSGGDAAGETCLPGRSLCRGTPEVELVPVVCSDNNDCPGGTTCEPNCPGGVCRGFCIGGDNAGGACAVAGDCASGGGGDDGVCSNADLDRNTLRPTPFPFEFPVIIHLSQNGAYKLLTEVTLLETENGELVLKTPMCDPVVCDGLQGALTVNGQPFARRVSTAAFSFHDDVEFDTGGGFTSALAGTTTISPNDPLNPFRHKFHPDHDCLDGLGDPLGPNALIGECFQITRSFVFAFDPNPPGGSSELDWGDSMLGGVFTEHVDGLHSETITSQGRFELRRVSSIGALNTPVSMGGQP